ncbi:MAG: hypothetical protein Q9M29_10100 [Mariprofundaceae bacterium]|nr:hypothetical protein [Mariprofundaceae bacterium]
MTAEVRALPGVFPLHEDREFLKESEWVILKLLCRPVETLADADAEELSRACGGQITVARCDELIRTVRIASLDGLGSWIARLLAEAGFSDTDVRTLPASRLMGRINERAGYPLCNDASMRALAELQRQWQGSETTSS